MKRDFERYPKYKDAYIRAFDRMVANHKDSIKILSNDENLSGGGYNKETILRWWHWILGLAE